MEKRVKFRKQFLNKEGEFELTNPKVSDRDFNATFMTVKELERGVSRAIKNAKKFPNKRKMYEMQEQAYRNRLAWFFD